MGKGVSSFRSTKALLMNWRQLTVSILNALLKEGNISPKHKYLRVIAKRMGLGSFQWQDKGQWAEIDAQDVLSEYEEKLVYCEGCRALPRVVESLSLEIFKPCLNTILCNLLWVNLLEQGVGPDHLQRSLPTPSSPGSCKTQMQLQECAGAKSALPMTKCIASHNTLTYRATARQEPRENCHLERHFMSLKHFTVSASLLRDIWM